MVLNTNFAVWNRLFILIFFEPYKDTRPLANDEVILLTKRDEVKSKTIPDSGAVSGRSDLTYWPQSEDCSSPPLPSLLFRPVIFKFLYPLIEAILQGIIKNMANIKPPITGAFLTMARLAG